MHSELTKTKIIVSVTAGVVFVVAVALFIIGATKPKVTSDQSDQMTTAPAAQTVPQKNKESKNVSEDKIEFEDPGDDEVGQEIKELDSLINQARPSELNGDDLSEEMIEGDIELE